MKKIAFLSIFILFFTNGLFSQTVDEVIEKHIDALGGKDKLLAIKSVRYTGSFSAGGFDAPLTLTIKRPGKVRLEISIQGMSLIRAYDGKIAWSINPFQGKQGPEKLPEDQEKQLKRQSDIDGSFLNYKEKGYKAELIGKEDLDSSQVYKIKLTYPDGDETYYYIDAVTYLIKKSTGKRKINGKDVDTETLYSGHIQVDGVMFPTVIDVRQAGQDEGQKAVMDKIETNVEVDDSIFKMPSIEK